ncbi:MAG: type II toxin-antitoxin system RelE/ParE family toxin [Nitrospinae bacterium]|nr:type II toxin-antitoxin system RelE/ParE family toxin [Nitrospinota bacterium]
MRSLENHAERRRCAPEFKNQAIRELFLKNYRIIYRIEDIGVEILRVIHGMRLLLN